MLGQPVGTRWHPSDLNCLFVILCVSVSAWLRPTYCRAAEFELRDGDRVVFLGDSLIEQSQYFGWIELMLTRSHPDRQITFRNLGWNADTPGGASRFGLSLKQAGHEPADEGWIQLQKQLELTQPNVLMIGYGMASALEQQTPANFRMELQRLLDRTRQISPNVRFVFLMPIAALNDPSLEQRLTDYREIIGTIAKENQCSAINLSSVASSMDFRKDSIHLNSDGYQAVAHTIQSQLGLADRQWESEDAKRLRGLIIRKNNWWFHRSRPANMAYVFGFRKHEQGQNAAEIPRFDALIAEEEARIAILRKDLSASLPPFRNRYESEFAKFTEQPTPEFTIDEEFEISLWAQNPDLNKPIHMNFDPQGRLWVASSEAYPMIEVGQSAPDKIIVLEDSDNDGRADRSTVFADGLLIPTGIAPGDGGVYVAQSTDLLHLVDTDGDGRADLRRRVLSGFGTEDTHHNLHTLNWGPDGRLYMNQSVYTRTDTETPHGVVRLKAGGGFRLDPNRLRMEIVFRGLWNSWGHQFDAYGQSFLSDGAGFAGIAYSFPGATFRPTPASTAELDLISPGNWPKFASLEIVTGNAFPPDWQGSIITCDFRANRVTRFSLSEQGAGYVTQQQPDLIRTSAATFRPIDVKQGPDGALYIADWSNPIINHGEVDFRDARRDRWHGRIWRLRWKGAPSSEKQNLAERDIPELLAALSSDDRYLRDQARRVLIDRSEATANALPAWLASRANPTDRLQALWLFQALNTPNIELLDELLQTEVANIRAAAVRVLSAWSDPACLPKPALDSQQTIARLSRLVRDSHPRVRLEAVRALGKQTGFEAGKVALQALDAPVDRFLEHALHLTVNELALPLIDALEAETNSSSLATSGPVSSGPVSGGLTEAQIEFLLTHVNPSLATRYLANRLEVGPLAKNGAGPWIELIGKAGGPAQLERLFTQTVQHGFDPGATLRALQTLRSAQQIRKLKPPGDLNRISPFLQHPSPAVRQASIQLAASWKLRGQLGAMLDFLQNKKQPAAVRRQAIIAIRELAGGQPPPQLSSTIDKLAQVARDADESSLRNQAVFAIAHLDSSRSVDLFFENLASIQSEQAAIELWRGTLNARGTGKLLAAKLAEQKLATHLVSAGLRTARDAGRKEPELLSVLQELAGEHQTIEFTSDYSAKLQAMVRQADPGRGEQIYRRPELACATCHAIGGIGGKVGPDMTSLGASAPVDYLVESLFVPNAKIKEGYHSVIVVTADDEIITGIENQTTDQELVLRDAKDHLLRIPLADIVAKRAGQSLMPVGVVDRLTLQEQADLVSFLSQLGKPGRYDASQGGVARAMEIFAGTHRAEQQGAERIVSGELVEGWKPALTLVNGDLPKRVLLELTKQPINISLVNVYARTTVEKGVAGETSFSVPSKVSIWIDGKPAETQFKNGQTQTTVPMQAGKHEILVRLDARKLPDVFRIASNDVTFLGW